MHHLPALLTIAHQSFRRHLTYRAAALAGLLTNFFFGLLRVALYLALLHGAESAGGLTALDAITYTALTQGIIAILAIFGWYELMYSVDSGQVASDLLKPLPLQLYWLAVDSGRAVAAFLLRTLSMVILFWLVFRIPLPSLTALPLIALSLILAWLVGFGWRFLVNLAAFWSPNALGIGRIAFGLSWVLSGFYIPLPFFPDWFQRLCQLTPFPAMVNTPVLVYLGQLPPADLASALLLQIIWAVVLLALSQLILRAGVRRLVIQGG